jgi:tetratricopeptide (TPR) repeat protein
MRGHRFWNLLPVLALLVALQAASQGQPTPNTQEVTPQPARSDSAPANARPVSLLAAEHLGDKLMDQGRYHAALDMYLRVESRTAKLWARIGNAYQLLFSFENAVSSYRESLRLEPDNARVMNNLAAALDQQGYHKNAELLYRKAIDLNPDSATYLRNLGTNLLAQHKFQEGSDAYGKALVIDPHILDNQSHAAMILSPAVNAEINYARARSCAEAGMTECAIMYLRKAIQEGAATRSRVTSDSDFQALLNDPDFKQFLAEQD